MDENKVREAGIRGPFKWDVVAAIKAAVEPLEERIDVLQGKVLTSNLYRKFQHVMQPQEDRITAQEKRLDEQEDVDIEIDDRVYYLEKCVHALEDRLEVLEDCESALPGQEKQQYKHEEYGVWHCNCGKRTFGTLPNYCSDCGKKR